MAKLTTRTLASGVTVDDLLHIVITGDTSQDPAGSSYKASIKQIFDAITGYCISDLYVSNIHSCSPLRINPLDEGNVYFGSTSGVTIDINSGGNIMNLGDVNIQSDNSINPYLIVAGFNAINRKGFIVNFDNPDTNTIHVANNNTSGSTVISASSILQSNKSITLEYGGDDYIRPAIAPVNGFDFYKNKGILSIGTKSDGMVINISPTGNTGNLWFEQNGNSIMYLKGGPSPSRGSLGLRLNPDGTEEPTANLQVGGTGTTGTFKYVDGNELNGWVLTSDNDGNATWQAPSGGGSVFTGGTVNGPTNFTNGLTANTMSASTLFVNGVQITGDTFVTGGTFLIDTITFTNNQNNTFQVTGITASGTTFTGGSGNCIADLYVTNVHGCSPISIWDETQTNGSNAYGTLSFSLGNSTKTYGNYSHANGSLTKTGSNEGYLLTGCTAGICTLDSSYSDVSLNFTTGTTSFVFFDDISYSSLYPSSVFSVSAVTFNGTNTVVYLYDTSVDTLGAQAIMSDTQPPTLWGGDQVFGGHNANATGQRTQAIGDGSTSKGSGSYSVGLGSSSEGQSLTYGIYGHAEGYLTTAYGNYSHSEGSGSNAIGIGSHAEGTNTQAIGSSSHAEGTNSVASGQYSHSEGSSTASGIFSHAQGDSSVASGQYSHSQNKGTLASGDNSHAGGVGTVSYGIVSFAHGDNNESNGPLSVSLGGMNNIVTSGDTDGGAILGGYENEITFLSPSDNVKQSAIIGGSGNTVNSFMSAIIGGENNTVSGARSVVLGGTGITAINPDTTYVPNFVISTSYTPTSSADTTGEPGSITWDNNYLYYKDTSGWKRLSGSTF